jgi:hypothetical protein
VAVEEEEKEEAVGAEEGVTVAVVLSLKVLPAQPEATLIPVTPCHSLPFKYNSLNLNKVVVSIYQRAILF